MKRHIQIKTGKKYNEVYVFDKNILIEIFPKLKNSFIETKDKLIYEYIDTELDLSLDDIERLSSHFDSFNIGTDGVVIKRKTII